MLSKCLEEQVLYNQIFQVLVELYLLILIIGSLKIFLCISKLKIR